VLGAVDDDAEHMTITKSRRSPARHRLLGLFDAHRAGVPATIQPGATVAGPIPQTAETPDRVICWPLDPTTREYLASRAKKRLLDHDVA
jgi:hypothetical protein